MKEFFKGLFIYWGIGCAVVAIILGIGYLGKWFFDWIVEAPKLVKEILSVLSLGACVGLFIFVLKNAFENDPEDDYER